jgi:glutathione S-transferase
MITIYHLDNSRSERIVWLAEELGLPYEQVTYLRDKGLAPAAYRAIHALGHAPVIRDGDQVLMESGAIVEWLVGRYGNGSLVPARGGSDYALYLQWLHFAEGSAMSGLLSELGSMLENTGREPTPRQRMWQQRNGAMLQYIDDELGQRPYFAGAEFSAADIMMEFVFSFIERYQGRSLDDHAHIAAWLRRVRERPAYQRMAAAAAPQVAFRRPG